MKHYLKTDNTVWAFEEDGSQDHLITPDMTPITIEERDQILAEAQVIPQVVTMRQARRALLDAGLYANVQAAIAAIPGVAGDAARIDWEFASTVNRDDPLVTALAGVLSLTEADLDDLFIAAGAIV